MNLETNTAIIIGEIDAQGNITTSTLENVSLARRVAKDVRVEVGFNTFDASINKEAIAASLGEYGVSGIEFVDAKDQLVAVPLGDVISKQVLEINSSGKSAIIIGSQTYTGRDVAAGVSVNLNVSVLANTSVIELSGEDLISSHQIFGGTKIAKVKMSVKNIAVVLMKPKSFVAQSTGALNPTISESASEGLESQKTTVISQEKLESVGVSLEDAKVVVSGGRGMGDADNYEKLVGGLAELLGAATGASRAIVDAGWVPYSKQVGQTGKTVKPDVYFACGISGATQHQVGMKSSKKIIAINTDIDAPVFAISDLAIVGDVNNVMPKLIDAIKAKKA